jgi:hypothetical protein
MALPSLGSTGPELFRFGTLIKTLTYLSLLLIFVSCGVGGEPREGGVFVFVCRADNDLYRVVKAAGAETYRYDSPEAAIEAAPVRAGMLMLAEGYPERTTPVSPAVLKSMESRNIRLYVEFPAALPDLAFGQPVRSRFERLVVTSEFASPLRPLQILTVNSLYWLPAVTSTPHIVAARVAGVDSAVFGLPKETVPILFESSSGSILISTTKLSHFVTGRYAPQEGWKLLWHAVMKWLVPGRKVPEINWTATVRPTYTCDEPLPPNVEEQALQRGVEWFVRSELLIAHEPAMGKDGMISRLDSLQTPDTGVADGTHGIMEAPLSIIQLDGNQTVSMARRGDCTCESAMALAFGGNIFGDAMKTRIARNLLDFWYITSDAFKRERGDPKHGAYGLSAWGVGDPAWYVANYGDDNARLLLATMAASALMQEERWDEKMMMCLLGNLRTTGQLGFRGDRIDIPELSAQGWKPFFERRIVSIAPHFEAYLWACYLWAYQQTGFQLFYQRAEQGLRMTMQTYTDGWRWANGLAQEKARILLPLAWLVRVKDTDEHRQWLNKAVHGLLALQQPCGTIQEELGLPGKGMFPPPESNEAYGINEASLVQKNGDPISDLLYTTNFAFLGLHEAAAAISDPRSRAAEDKLAQFLCRIQIRSEAHPTLDGGWFRAFDVKRWEAWGSNADAGWGAWAIESGWTQGWITAVLALRQMNTSLWELSTRSRVARYFEPLRKVMLPDKYIRSFN